MLNLGGVVIGQPVYKSPKIVHLLSRCIGNIDTHNVTKYTKTRWFATDGRPVKFLIN